MCSDLFVLVYGRAPLLGRLRSSVAVVRRDGRLLLQQRADGRGWGLPGGVALFWEDATATLERELREETGLRTRSARLLAVERDDHYIPSLIHVFAVEAEGEVRGSWEGEPAWMDERALPAPLFAPHAAIIARIVNNAH